MKSQQDPNSCSARDVCFDRSFDHLNKYGDPHVEQLRDLRSYVSPCHTQFEMLSLRL